MVTSNIFYLLFGALVLLVNPTEGDIIPCIPRKFDQDSIVCVCNSTYCDEIFSSTNDDYNSYTTTLDGKRFDYASGTMGLSPTMPDFAEIGNETFQEIIGFGGAFTDAATINIRSLSNETQEKLINSYFTPLGIGYTMGRVPIASCDFSKRVYSYDDQYENDTDLKYFSLAQEDELYKIPVIQAAIKASKRKINLFGSPWSSPAWMKSNNNMTGAGQIKGQPGGPFYQSWAKYFVKFLQEYQKRGIHFWGLTAQNEPSFGIIGINFQCLGFTPELQRDFIGKDLGPMLENFGFGHIKLMILDDQRAFLPYWAEVVLDSAYSAAKYVSGIGVHWYEDQFIPPSALDRTYEKFGRNYFMLNTEACVQDLIDKKKYVALGSWYHAERYFRDIMQDLTHKMSGWIDWNLALDMSGGPNWVNNFADSPIIVNAEKDEFYKQPMFYAMGHFSKFVVPGSKMVEIHNQIEGIDMLAFMRPDNSIALVVGNYDDVEKSFTVHDSKSGYLNSKVLPKSFTTFTWSRR